MSDELAECDRDGCPTPAVARMGDKLVCAEDVLWGAEHLKKTGQPLDDVSPLPHLPATTREGLRDYRL